MSGLEALEQMLGRDHPDIKYLSQEHIALVLSKALAETYGEHPNDPVEFFSKYLLNHVSMQKKAIACVEAEKAVICKREEHRCQMEEKKVQAEEQVICE